jgi:hypothetical protein
VVAQALRALVLDPTDSGPLGSSRNVGRQSQLVICDPNDVARVQLPAAALISFSVHPYLRGREERLDLGATVDHASELQQLAEPNHLAANRHVSHHLRKLSAHLRCTVDGACAIASVLLLDQPAARFALLASVDG